MAVGWYNKAWTVRKALTIDKTKVASNLTNFPVLVSLTTDAILATFAQADGDDILFTDSDGTAKLDHDIVYYSAGTLVCHVEIPALTNANNYVIYMYAGNPAATAQKNTAGTWNSNYKRVWHLSEASGNLVDSTGNATITTLSGDYAQTGKIYKSFGFDGTNDYLTLGAGTATDIDFQRNEAFSLSFWMYSPTDTLTANLMVLNNKGAVSNAGYQIVTQTNQRFYFLLGSGGATKYWINGTTSSIPNKAWFLCHCTYDGSESINGMKVYINGGAATGATTDNDCGTPIDYTGNTFYAGQDGAAANRIAMSMECLRVLNVALTAEWITTTYNSHNAPASFYSVGTVEKRKKVIVI